MISFNDKGNKKSLVYECLTADNCSEILAKLHFLRVINKHLFIIIIIE